MSLIDRTRMAPPAPGLQPAARPTARASARPASDSRVASTPADLAKTLPAAQQQAFQQLAPADQQAFATVWQASSAVSRNRLGKLLTAGTLAQKDSQGGSLVANLAALSAAQVPAGAPYGAKDALAQTLEHLTTPDVINQSSRNTCGATTIQYMLITQQPAEYARLVTGVMGAGSVKVQKGGDLRRVADSVAKDDTNRDDVERVVQAALMNYGGDYRGSYSNTTDRFKHEAGGGLLGKLKGAVMAPVNFVFDKMGANLGLAEGMVNGLYEDVLGKNGRVAGDLPGGQLLAPQFMRKGVYDQVAKALKSGPVPVDILTENLADRPGETEEHVLDQSKMSYSEKMLSHQVLVTKIESGRVHYRNPWGYQTSLSETEFRSRLTDAIIPE